MGIFNRRTTYTRTNPFTPHLRPQSVIAVLHNHGAMIELNPTVTAHHEIPIPATAAGGERLAVWHEFTETVPFLPGVLGSSGSWASSTVTPHAAFHDTPSGLETHVYAPLGLEVRGTWSVRKAVGSGERMVVVAAEEEEEVSGEEGLYHLCEDVAITGPWFLTGFARKEHKKNHEAMVERLFGKAQQMERESSVVGRGGDARRSTDDQTNAQE